MTIISGGEERDGRESVRKNLPRLRYNYNDIHSQLALLERCFVIA